MSSKVQNYNLGEDACLEGMALLTAHVFPLVLKAALELDLFSIIAKAGHGAYVSPTEIASHLPTKNPDAPCMLDRMLHLFATHSLLYYSSGTLENGRVEKLYGLTPACKFFLQNEEANLFKALTLSHQPPLKEAWLNMKDAILEGGNPFKNVHGIPMFEYMNQVPALSTTFNQAMAGLSTIVMREILEKYKGFEGLASLVDVGGGIGRSLNMITSKYPTIHGINYDLPHVIQTAPPYAGIEHVEGNMFVSVPTADAIMIKDTCHNWSDESIVKVFENIHEALPDNGKLIIINIVIPEVPETTQASQCAAAFDNSMLTLLAGRERSARDLETLTKAAGFSNFRVACVACGIWAVTESYK